MIDPVISAAFEDLDAVIGCGNVPCYFKKTKGQHTNGRCRCVELPHAPRLLAALYHAVKAAREEAPRDINVIAPCER